MDNCTHYKSNIKRPTFVLSQIVQSLPIMNKRHKCPHCSQDFTQKLALHSHLLIHAGIKQYSCTKCSKTFTQKTALTVHMKSFHLKIKTHKCVGCEATFSTLDELKMHSGTHERHKQYKCSFCPASFAQKGALLRHIHSAIHTGKVL